MNKINQNYSIVFTTQQVNYMTHLYEFPSMFERERKFIKQWQERLKSNDIHFTFPENSSNHPSNTSHSPSENEQNLSTVESQPTSSSTSNTPLHFEQDNPVINSENEGDKQSIADKIVLPLDGNLEKKQQEKQKPQTPIRSSQTPKKSEPKSPLATLENLKHLSEFESIIDSVTGLANEETSESINPCNCKLNGDKSPEKCNRNCSTGNKSKFCTVNDLKKSGLIVSTNGK